VELGIMFFIIYVPGVNYLCQTNSGTTLCSHIMLLLLVMMMIMMT
jgi:membrane-anchored glycerophosphoryl diester phosphodiesterase (GDPDase)